MVVYLALTQREKDRNLQGLLSFNLHFDIPPKNLGRNPQYADMAELVDALVLGTSPKGCRFESCYLHCVGNNTVVYIHMQSLTRELVSMDSYLNWQRDRLINDRIWDRTPASPLKERN